MRRLVATAATAAALGLVALAGVPATIPATDQGAHGGPAAPAVDDGAGWQTLADDRECKPRGPIAIELATRRSGERLQVAWSVTPRLDLAELAWELRLPPGAQLLEGTSAGVADPKTGTTSHGRASVHLPPAHLADELGLTATGRLVGPSGAPDATVVVERSLTHVGHEPQVGTRLALPPLDGRAGVVLQVVPSTHRPGR